MLCGFGLIVLGIAAVATIPTARAVVIGIVTVAVAFEHEVGAATALAFDRRIKTAAFLAVTELHFGFGATTITPIPAATTIIVIVVTLAISFP